MKRLGDLVTVVILVSMTFVVTEWFHYRSGAPPLFEYLLGTGGAESPAKDDDAGNVTEPEFQIYLHVLEAMQADRSLSIETAVDHEHIPLDKFREIEQRVQRNDVLVDRVRQTLRERAETLWNARTAPRDHG